MLRLLAGDIVCFFVAAILGFATHQELEWSSAPRFLATWFPFTAAWLIVAFPAGVYASPRKSRWAGIARAVWAAAISAPLGGVLRSAWLGGGVLPVFVAVMAAVNVGLILVWRLAESMNPGRA
ncbi:MAG TPA: DUF3054 domain-containing protein [Anaerolineales bacterium]|nr:DUF3054 domain-containing protein [Anaerolineales bacterium]